MHTAGWLLQLVGLRSLAHLTCSRPSINILTTKLRLLAIHLVVAPQRFFDIYYLRTERVLLKHLHHICPRITLVFSKDRRNMHSTHKSSMSSTALQLGSRLPSIATNKATVSGARALLHPVSTQVVMKHAQNVAESVVKTHSSLSSWSFMGARRRPVGSHPNPNKNDTHDTPLITERTSKPIITETINSDPLFIQQGRVIFLRW